MDSTTKFRQIHLDFHTSEAIPGIGSEFDAEEFASVLEEASVDSVTCFARCHHGWLYYDSKSNPELIHPNLVNKNLLKEQIEACHKRGIKVPIYTTIQWDAKVAREHYDWLCLDETGAPFGQVPFKASFWRNICVNSGYVEYFKAHLKDIFDYFGEIDGLFLDILNIKPCCCNNCLADMQKLGLNAEDETVRYNFAQLVFDKFQREITDYINEFQPGCPVFYNNGYLGSQHRKNKDTFTHFEIESLPGGPWGYNHYPVTALYARSIGLPIMGQTGKFHRDWGDFSSLRYLPALQYECFKSLAYGGYCSIGDQLHPNGKINRATYNLVGKVYKEVAKKQAWCIDTTPVVEAAIFTPSEFKRGGTHLATDEMVAAVRLMNELSIQVDVVDSYNDFSKYKFIILPDNVTEFGEAFESKIKEYIDNGGSLITSYKSGMVSEDGKMAEFMPADVNGLTDYTPDFIVANGAMAKGLEETEYVMYLQGMKLLPREGAEVLLDTKVPYFNRTWEHFCSHKHTPNSEEYGSPALVKKGNIYQFAHPIFTMQEEYATEWVKLILKNVVESIISNPIVKHNGPSILETKIHNQEKENRYVLHLLNYIPVRKCKNLDIVDTVIPLHNIEVTVQVDKGIKKVMMVPEQKELEHKVISETQISFVVPMIEGHNMIELSY